MDRQAGIGMKYRYLMLIFKMSESSEVETDYIMTGGRKIVQTDGNNVLNIGIW